MAPKVNPGDLKKIIEQGDAVTLVNSAEVFGGVLVTDGLTTSQIRNIFGEVRRIEADWQSDSAEDARANLRRLLLLKPRMAYQQKRIPGASSLIEVLTEAVNLVAGTTEPQEQFRRFRHFSEFFEAILAYHTAKDGKKS